MLSEYGTAVRTFFQPEELIQWYHDLAQPGTSFLVERAAIDEDVAAVLSICFAVFVPLFFLGSLVFAMLGFSGSSKYAPFRAC
jgi:hypothetical protein